MLAWAMLMSMRRASSETVAACHSERHEGGNVTLAVAPSHLQDGRNLARPPFQGERQLRKKRRQAGDVVVVIFLQEILIVKNP